jgi:hypothetical protein
LYAVLYVVVDGAGVVYDVELGEYVVNSAGIVVDLAGGELEYKVISTGVVEVGYKGTFSLFIYTGLTVVCVFSVVLVCVFSVVFVLTLPVAGSNPNEYNTKIAIIVIKMNGIDIINHAKKDMLFSHIIFSNKVTIIPIHILTNAMLYNP